MYTDQTIKSSLWRKPKTQKTLIVCKPGSLHEAIFSQKQKKQNVEKDSVYTQIPCRRFRFYWSVIVTNSNGSPIRLFFGLPQSHEVQCVTSNLVNVASPRIRVRWGPNLLFLKLCLLSQRRRHAIDSVGVWLFEISNCYTSRRDKSFRSPRMPDRYRTCVII